MQDVFEATAFFAGFEIPAEDLFGEEGRGFEYILHGMNPERVLLAAEAIGIGRVALKKAAAYAKEYHVERYLREVMIPRIAPISPQLVLCYIAEKVLGLPKSY